MEIIKGRTNFDFIGKRRVAIYISTVVNLSILIGIIVFKFNWGVDFAGGTLVELKFDQPITAEQLRKGAVAGGMKDPQVQGIGPTDEHSFIVRLGGVTQLTKDSAAAAEKAIRGLGEVATFTTDLDNGQLMFRSKIDMAPAAVKGAVEQAGVGVQNVGKTEALGGQGWDYTVISAGLAGLMHQQLEKGLPGVKFQVQRTDYVGPQVGEQLRNKGIAAIVLALLAILIYVAFRFDLKFGPGALVATVHDVVMVAGYYLVSRREFNLTSIAVLLTVLGYSINDTIVIYDRIREEMVRYKGKPLPEIINIAVNDTLSRTILTGGVTALSLIGLLVFGVGEIFDFAAAMLVGIIVGTYSSVYIASPLTIWLDEREAARAKAGRGLKAKTA